jgi:hypothetical protein
MAYHIEKLDARFGRKVYYTGNNQWNQKKDYSMIFETEASARRECNRVRGTIVKE